MDTLFWSLDNLSVTWPNLFKEVGIRSDPPPSCWDSGQNLPLTIRVDSKNEFLNTKV